MNEAVIRTRLLQLGEKINGKPGSGSAKGVYVPQEVRPSDVESILDSLELMVTYMMFDVDATRRENKYLRQIVETRPQPPRTDDADFPPGV